MKIVIPMAGRGSRFANDGIKTPKPLISVGDRPMVWWALQSLKGIPYSTLVFIALKEHEQQYNLSNILKNFGWKNTEIILLNDVTKGQLCTVIAASSIINDDEDILISSSDTYVVSTIGDDIKTRPADCHGIISVANMPGNSWSFARADYTGRVVDVAEKVRISNHASTGLYYFSNGKEFVKVAKEMIYGGKKTHGEFYVIPVYKEYIKKKWRVDISSAQEMWDMGTPKAKRQFELFLKRKFGKTKD